MDDAALVKEVATRLERARYGGVDGSTFAHLKRVDENAWQALSYIALEVIRQREEEGWAIEHDDQHARGEIAAAASCYAANACLQIGGEKPYPKGQPPAAWMWGAEWWKPKNVNRDLIRAGALIVAEWSRFMRANIAKAARTTEPRPKQAQGDQ